MLTCRKRTAQAKASARSPSNEANTTVDQPVTEVLKKTKKTPATACFQDGAENVSSCCQDGVNEKESATSSCCNENGKNDSSLGCCQDKKVVRKNNPITSAKKKTHSVRRTVFTKTSMCFTDPRRELQKDSLTILY